MAYHIHALKTSKMTQIKQVVEVPAEEFKFWKESTNKILNALENLKLTPPSEYLTALEFMEQTKMSRWKFDTLRDNGKLNIIQRGRKLYLASSEVKRYFSGDMEST